MPHTHLQRANLADQDQRVGPQGLLSFSVLLIARVLRTEKWHGSTAQVGRGRLRLPTAALLSRAWLCRGSNTRSNTPPPWALPPFLLTAAAAAWCAAACFITASAGEMRVAEAGPKRPPPGGRGGREAARVLTKPLPPLGLVGFRWAFSSSRRMPRTRVSRWEAAGRAWHGGVGDMCLCAPGGRDSQADKCAGWACFAGRPRLGSLWTAPQQPVLNHRHRQACSNCQNECGGAMCRRCRNRSPLGQRLTSTMRAMASACRSRVSRSCATAQQGGGKRLVAQSVSSAKEGQQLLQSHNCATNTCTFSSSHLAARLDVIGQCGLPAQSHNCATNNAHSAAPTLPLDLIWSATATCSFSARPRSASSDILDGFRETEGGADNGCGCQQDPSAASRPQGPHPPISEERGKFTRAG